MIVNPPMFVYLVKGVAAQFFEQHALDKFVFLESQEEFFEKLGDKERTPVEAEGTDKFCMVRWMQDRGYVKESKDK